MFCAPSDVAFDDGDEPLEVGTDLVVCFGVVDGGNERTVGCSRHRCIVVTSADCSTSAGPVIGTFAYGRPLEFEVSNVPDQPVTGSLPLKVDEHLALVLSNNTHVSLAAV